MESAKEYGLSLWNKSLGFLNSDGLIPQLVLTVVIILAIHLIISTVESLVMAIKDYNKLSATLLPYTYISDGIKDAINVTQNPTQSLYPFMYPSSNETNGMEFSYSFHLYIDPKMYETTEKTFKNVFYKGSADGPWPNMAPGVFVHSGENIMRIYMNAIDTVEGNYVEVPNLPVGKWFHTVITQKGQHMDVYINGNIAVRRTFLTVPRINFGGVYVFSQSSLTTQNTDNFTVKEAMKGMISRLKYYAYALSFNQIESLYYEGASDKIVSKSFDFKPPYMHDSWWVTRFNPASAHYGL
jgi:hypothetical protein